MSEQVTVKEVGPGNPWQHGITYFDVVFDRNGHDFEASWGTKGDAPVAGERVTGEFFQKDGNWKFKKGSSDSKGGSEASTGPGSGSSPRKPWVVESERDPERAARILRQHSQEMALRLLAGSNFRVDATNDTNVQNGLRFVSHLADYFDQDVMQAGQAAAQGAGATPASPQAQGGSPSTSPAPEQRSADDTAQYFSKLLEDAAMDPVAAVELGKFIAFKFSDDQRKRAENGLRELESQQETVKRLTSAYEKSEAKLLPLSTDEDGKDIPF